MSELGDLLRKLRGGLSLRDAAKRAGVSHNYLSVVEKGYDPRSKSPVKPSPETLQGLSKAYNYDYQELMKVAGYLPDTDEFINDTKSGEGVNEQSASKDYGFAFYGGGKDWTEEEIELAEAAIEAHRAAKKKAEEKLKGKKGPSN